MQQKEHPRARGENQVLWPLCLSIIGTSPRTRGKLEVCHFFGMEVRNIPAHAGKTAAETFLATGTEEHPRARGENLGFEFPKSVVVGTSPRTRGKPRRRSWLHHRRRNIPAHAGKTGAVPCVFERTWEHPRARGENIRDFGRGFPGFGTSPRTRGKRLLTCGSSFLKVILHSVLFSRTMGV